MIGALIDLAVLLRNQRRPLEQLRAIQLRKLRHMLHHAYEHVPYYRRMFDSLGLKPGDIASVEDLRRLPTTSRRQMQELPRSELVADNIPDDHCVHLTTAGSTGSPLTVLLSPRDNIYKDMVWARTALASGKRLTDTTAYFKFQFPPPKWFERWGIWPRVNISLEDPYERKAQLLRAHQPKIIRANAFELVGLAHFLLQNGIHDIRPRMVFSMGSLLDDVSRAELEAAFSAPVYDCYGATELGCVAWQCPESKGMHINMDTTVIEFLNGDKPAEPGEPARMICTALHAFAMPFIRYDIGDIAVLDNKPCPCGRTLPLLRSLQGRADDFLVTPDGQRISPSKLVNRLKRTPGILQFKLVQRRPNYVQAVVVPGSGFDESSKAWFIKTFAEIMGKEVMLTFSTADQIPREASGKIRSLVLDLEGVTTP